jgi:hypothetical protein
MHDLLEAKKYLPYRGINFDSDFLFTIYQLLNHFSAGFSAVTCKLCGMGAMLMIYSFAFNGAGIA